MALNTRTVGEVLDYVKRTFGDEAGYQIKDADIIRATNQACMEIVSKNKVIRASAVINSVQHQDEYQKPEDTLQITGVRYGDIVLQGVGFDTLQTTLPLSGDVQYWSQYADKLIISGRPPSSGVQIKVYYVAEPDRVTASTDTLPIPDRYFDRVCEFVMAKMYEIDENWQGLQLNRQLFEDNLNLLSHEEDANEGPFNVIADYNF